MGSPNKIGDIQPYAELHQGATTTVYKGFQKSLDRFVLLKILHPEFSRDKEIAARFEEEARLAAKIQHPNVVSVYAYGKDEGRAYIAAEYVDGTTLAALTEEGALPPNIAGYILTEAANALQAAHNGGVLHRDIKPSNILISNEGRVKVTDFGMASLQKIDGKGKSQVRGTLAYLAPEQVLGKEPKESSDLFSLGATFFEMLLGTPAFKGSNSGELLDQVLNFDPSSALHDDDDIPSQLRRICQQLLKKKVEQRYQNCKVLLADLNAFRKSRGQGAIASAVDMKSYLEDPEAYVRKLRDKPVSLRTREAKPERSERRPVRERKDTAAQKPAFNINKPKLLGIIGLIVFVFVGFSFASDFFFSKSGSFGANNNPNGGASSASTGGGRAVTRSGGSSGGGTPVRSEGANPQRNPSTPPAESREPEAVVTVVDEREGNEEQTAADPQQIEPDITSDAQAVPDTVVLVADTNRPPGKMIIDALPWAAVFLGGDSLGVTPLPLVVSPGTYAITLKNPDFPPFETLVDVVPGRETPFKISLWSLVGQVQVEVFPFAEVSINGVYRDETPLDKPLIVKPGEHTITLKHPSLGTFERTFDVRAGEEKTLKYNLNEL